MELRHACMQRLLKASVMLTSLLVSCVAASPAPLPPRQTALPSTTEVILPAPRTESSVSLEEALLARHSVRDFAAEPLSIQEIAQLFWAAQGVTRPWGGRTAPSAGALYPLEIYVATAEGVLQYLPGEHGATRVLDEDIRQALWGAGLRQEAIRQAPAIFVITAVYERTAAKYGVRAERYVKLEAGHAAQNLLLQAVALDLGAVPIGAYQDDEVSAILELAPHEEPLYLIPVGHPSE